MRDEADRRRNKKRRDRQAAMSRDKRAQQAYQQLEVGQSVRTPDGWTGFISEKNPNGYEVYVESWDVAGEYYAHNVEPVDKGGSNFI